MVLLVSKGFFLFVEVDCVMLVWCVWFDLVGLSLSLEVVDVFLVELFLDVYDQLVD